MHTHIHKPDLYWNVREVNGLEKTKWDNADIIKKSYLKLITSQTALK